LSGGSRTGRWESTHKGQWGRKKAKGTHKDLSHVHSPTDEADETQAPEKNGDIFKNGTTTGHKETRNGKEGSKIGLV